MSRAQGSRGAVLAGLLLTACPGGGSGDEADGSSQEGPGTDTSTTDGIADIDTDGGVKLDMNVQADLPPGEESGCEKIDFLFVIDSSGSMADNQANLIASFPGLVTAMTENVAADDWHVMVVDTDGQWGGTDCANACMTLGFCPDEPAFPCDAPPPGFCDISLGAGEVGPMGEAASNVDCQLAGGARYIQKAEPDLLSAFSCVAKVGVDGSDAERPMDALLRALDPELEGEGGCNEGFVRDDAILVVTLITDEPDIHSLGDPADWADAVIAAKGGNPDAVVVLGLLPDGELAQPLCGVEAVLAPRLTAFLELFTASSWASVCEPDYSPFFVEAVSVIGEACDDFVPIG